MSRNKLVLVSLVGMFMLAQSLYAQRSGLTYSIIFNGYCDGLTVTVGSNGFVTGTHDNYDCAGSQTWVDGINSITVGKFDSLEDIGPISLADNIGVLLLDNSATTYYLNFKNSTWGLYVESDGVLPEQWWNGGTFSVVEAFVTSGAKKASWQKRSASVTEPNFTVSGYPTGTFELLFWDNTHSFEYCDYFQLTAYGDVVGGVHNYADGCGIGANAPAGGNYTFLGNGIVVIGTPHGPLGVVGGRGLLTTDNSGELIGAGDVTFSYYFSFQSGIWAVYETDGTTGFQLINWGTLAVVQVDPLKGTKVTHPVGGIPSTTRH